MAELPASNLSNQQQLTHTSATITHENEQLMDTSLAMDDNSRTQTTVSCNLPDSNTAVTPSLSLDHYTCNENMAEGVLGEENAISALFGEMMDDSSSLHSSSEVCDEPSHSSMDSQPPQSVTISATTISATLENTSTTISSTSFGNPLTAQSLVPSHPQTGDEGTGEGVGGGDGDLKLQDVVSLKDSTCLERLFNEHPELHESLKTILQNNEWLLQNISESSIALAASSNALPSSDTSSLLTNPVTKTSEEVPGNIPKSTGLLPSEGSSRRPVLAQIIQRGPPMNTLGTPVSRSQPQVPPTVKQTLSTATCTSHSSIPTAPLVSCKPNPSLSQSTSTDCSPSYFPLLFPRDALVSSIDSTSDPPSPLPISISLPPTLAPLSHTPSPSASTPTVMQPIDHEPMDVDVGQTAVPLDRPSHLLDHDYCLYNPTLSAGTQGNAFAQLSIPSERLSYAPEVPDSPRTLYKLLKILPRRVSSTSRVRAALVKTPSTPSSSRAKTTK